MINKNPFILKKEQSNGLVAAVIQSNYIPWLGYFSIAAAADIFVVYEDVQYTKNDWRNRNQIMTGDKHIWMTIPTIHEHLGQNFMETRVAGHWWAKKHFQTLANVFSKSNGWASLETELHELYKKAEKFNYLHEINRIFLDWAYQKLDINSKIIYLDNFPKKENPTIRLVEILQSIGASHYLSGPSASSYLKSQIFDEANISIEFVDYQKLIPAVFNVESPIPTTSFLQYILEKN